MPNIPKVVESVCSIVLAFVFSGVAPDDTDAVDMTIETRFAVIN